MKLVDSLIASLFELQINLLHARLRLEADTDDEALHDLRIALQRLRSLLAPLRRVADLPPLYTAAAALGALTAPVRDLEVLARLRYEDGPRAFLDTLLRKLEVHHPTVFRRIDTARFDLANGPLDLLQGGVTPTVRHGHVDLGGGKRAIALGDVHAVVDPLCGQGANMASYAAFVLGEEIVRQSMVHATAKLAQTSAGTPKVVVYKNNSDGKGNSYGCHENYLLARETPFGRIVAQVTPHFVTRQLFCGAGKVGCELPGVPHDEVPYQLSQRADFFEEEVGLETTLKRPIVNTRDEPHCDAQKYRRLHVIVGDANIS